MPTVLAKFLHLGMTVDQVIATTTNIPANVTSRPELGTEREGSDVDVSLLVLKAGRFPLWIVTMKAE